MNLATPPPWDLFISYRRTDAEIVKALAGALQHIKVSVCLDCNEIDDADSIQARIDQGLANCRALLAWYSVDYSHSRPCQWELTAALIAARAETAPVRRLLVVNPETDTGHLVLPQVRDIKHLRAPNEISDRSGLGALAGRIAELLRPIQGTFGALRALSRPPWYGYAALGSNRFIGRVQDLWDIHTALSAGDFAIVCGQPAPISHGQLTQLRGSGGIGKSLLAEEYALRFGTFWPGGVFWLRAYGNSDRPKESAEALARRRDGEYHNQLANFALAQGVNVGDIRKLNSPQIRATLANRLQPLGPYLWIVDDLPDCDRTELGRWLAPSNNGQTLLTTRSRRHDALGKSIDLSLLPPTDALALLTRDRTPQDAIETAAVKGILSCLVGHALALDVARAACQRQGYAGFLTRLQQPNQDALALAAQLAGELPNGHNPSIAVTFLGSLQTLSLEGLDFLRLCAQLAAAPVDRRLVARCLKTAGNLEEQTAVDRAYLGMHHAIQASLAEEVQGRQAATVHALIAQTLRLNDNDTDRQRVLREAALSVLDADLEPVAAIRHHDVLQDNLAHARVLAEQPVTVAEYVLIGRLGRYESERGNYPDAEEFYRQQHEGYARLLGEEDPDTLTSMSNLAETLRDQGHLADARALHGQVLAVQRRGLGEEDPDTLTSMSNLAETLRDQGHLACARALHEQVLATRRRLLGEEDPDTLTSMHNLAGTLRAQGDLANARALHEQVLATRRRLLGEEDPDTLTSMGNLAGTLWAQDELAAARALQKQVLATRRRLLGEEHPETLTSMHNLAVTLCALDKLAAAQALQKKALAISRRLLGEEHPATLTTIDSLAVTLRAKGDLHTARALHEQVLAAQRRLLGEEHPDTSLTAWNLYLTLDEIPDDPAAQAAQAILDELLRWLLLRDPATLSATQRAIQEEVQNRLSR
ncbi:tetratricopeptide repeat protein [Billgrantia montanilacus]|nr:tetratricopeptide repeat protein [Halomonas montanilacus]